MVIHKLKLLLIIGKKFFKTFHLLFLKLTQIITFPQFVEKLRQDPPTREMKIGLLYDIAQEFSVEWNDNALRQILYTQSSLCEVSL